MTGALFIATALYSVEGGLERFNQRFVRSLAELEEAGALRGVIVIALWDGTEHAGRAPSGVRFIAGCSRKARTVLTFLSLLLRRRLDVIMYGHIGFAPLAIIGRILKPRSRHLLVVHGVEVWRPPTFLRRIAVRRCIDAVIAVSRFTSRRMSPYFGLREEKFVILPNALDVPAGTPEAAGPPASPLEGRWRLLTVSRLSLIDTYKNIDKVVQALPAILADFPDTHYYIVGDGPWRLDLERLVNESGVNDHVHFLGSVDDPTRDAVYDRSHVFVLPSTGEGFGIVFLEAWRHSLPPIASDQDAASELIRDGVDGLCVPPRPDAIAEAVCSLLADPDRRRAMGAEGRRRLEERYTHGRFRERLTEILLSSPTCAA